MPEILVVEDGRTLGLTLVTALRLEGHHPTLCTHLGGARRAMTERGFDLVLLDLGLPDGDGVDLLREIRAGGKLLPVLVLTARGALDSKVAGLRAGADDYLTKPFDLPELLARVDAQLRRAGWQDGEAAPTAPILIGRLTVDTHERTATRDGTPVPLTDLELELLSYLARNEGKAIAREELLEKVWGISGSVQTRTVDVFVARLRKLIEPDPAKPQHLLSVRGHGYRLVR
jgi:DNA-binding response OmpR family regulator